MLNIELTNLRAAELQRLLEVARARSQTQLERELLAELTRRSGGGSGGDVIAMSAQAPVAQRPPPRRRGGVAAFAAMAATVVVAGGIGWGVAPEVLSAFSPAPVQPISGPTQRTLVAYEAVATPAPAAPAASLAEAATLTADAAAEAPVSAQTPAPNLPPQRLAVALTAAPSRAAPPAPPTASPSPAAKRAENPCLSLPIPGERLVCGYPSLANADRELQRAYDHALSAGADPQAIEASKAQWKQARNRVWERGELSELYSQRIRDVEDGAATAKANSPPF